MNSHLSAIRVHLLALTVLVLAAYGCGTSGGVPSVSHTPYPDSAAIEGITWGSGPFVLGNPKTGLADLSSYTATLTLSFDGTQDGSAKKWTKTYVMLASLDPPARELTVQKSGDLTHLDTVNLAERDGTSYSWPREGACTDNAIDQGESLSALAEPAGFLGPVVGAQEAGSEKVNGVRSNHYTFNGHALAQEDLAQSTGELWVAADGGYVVRYLLTTTGQAAYFGEGIEGALTEDYELTDVGKPVVMTLPADCPPGLVQAPQLTDAANVVNDSGVLTYTTASTPQKTAAFYQKELLKLGWKATGEPLVDDSSAYLKFEKDGETLFVSATIQDDGTKTVQIMTLRIQK